MECMKCKYIHRHNTWTCKQCGASLKGGVVIITSISGSGADKQLKNVVDLAQSEGHRHEVRLHDVGKIMHEFAKHHEPDIRWERILDVDQRALSYLRALAFQQIVHAIETEPEALHLIDLHLSFRWRSYLTNGLAPHILEAFAPHVRFFINLIEDLTIIQERLSKTSWGKRQILELLIWRDEELFLSTIFADICGRVDCFTVATGEPPTEIERLIWHPETPKVYLSFPITEILTDSTALHEIETFRDHIRKFLIVFDPYVSKDYDETYQRSEMLELRKEVGETLVDRDYRFIDQADAVVVYFPQKVPSKGVDAELNHARRTGKRIFLYCPEDIGGSPFAVPATHYRNDREEYINLLKEKLLS